MGAPIHYRLAGETPSSHPGTPTVCGHCGRILIYGQGLILRLPTLFELHRWMCRNPDDFAILLSMSDFFHRRARHNRG
jgi:hypothetical protein